jgi:hypothetical protein
VYAAPDDDVVLVAEYGKDRVVVLDSDAGRARHVPLVLGAPIHQPRCICANSDLLAIVDDGDCRVSAFHRRNGHPLAGRSFFSDRRRGGLSLGPIHSACILPGRRIALSFMEHDTLAVVNIPGPAEPEERVPSATSFRVGHVRACLTSSAAGELLAAFGSTVVILDPDTGAELLSFSDDGDAGGDELAATDRDPFIGIAVDRACVYALRKKKCVMFV